MISLLKKLNFSLKGLGTLESNGLVGNVVLQTLQIAFSHLSMHIRVLSCIQEGRILLNFVFKPLPDFALKVWLAALTQCLT
jgi:hypothetical protein